MKTYQVLVICAVIVVMGLTVAVVSISVYHSSKYSLTFNQEKPDVNYAFHQSYTEIHYRDMDGNAQIAKIPNGYRVCHCYSDPDGIGFDCVECELYR